MIEIQSFVDFPDSIFAKLSDNSWKNGAANYSLQQLPFTFFNSGAVAHYLFHAIEKIICNSPETSIKNIYIFQTGIVFWMTEVLELLQKKYPIAFKNIKLHLLDTRSEIVKTWADIDGLSDFGDQIVRHDFFSWTTWESKTSLDLAIFLDAFSGIHAHKIVIQNGKAYVNVCRTLLEKNPVVWDTSQCPPQCVTQEEIAGKILKHQNGKLFSDWGKVRLTQENGFSNVMVKDIQEIITHFEIKEGAFNYSPQIEKFLKNIITKSASTGSIIILDLAITDIYNIKKSEDLILKKGEVNHHFLFFENLERVLNLQGLDVEIFKSSFAYQGLWVTKSTFKSPDLDFEEIKAFELHTNSVIESLLVIPNPKSYLQTLIFLEKQLSDIQKNDYKYNLQIAYGLIERGLHNEGLEYLSRNFKKFGKFDILGHRLYAKIRRKEHQFESCRKHLNEALSIAPDYGPLLMELVALEIDCENWIAAAENMLHLIRVSGNEWISYAPTLRAIEKNSLEGELKSKIVACLEKIKPQFSTLVQTKNK